MHFWNQVASCCIGRSFSPDSVGYDKVQQHFTSLHFTSIPTGCNRDGYRA